MRQRGLVYIARGGRGINIGELDGGAVDVSDWYVCDICVPDENGIYPEICDQYDPASGNYKAWHTGRHPQDDKNWLIVPANSDPRNLLPNAEFQTGPGGWGVGYSSSEGVKVIKDSKQGPFGQYAQTFGRTASWHRLTGNMMAPYKEGKLTPGTAFSLAQPDQSFHPRVCHILHQPEND
jgi:hypothetical protein